VNFRVPLWWERIWPWLFTLLTVAVWYFTGKSFPKNTDGLFAASAAVAAVFASFLGVAQALILSVKGTESYKVLERLGYTPLLFDYLRVGILSSVAFATLSIIGFFVDENVKPLGVNLYGTFEMTWVASGALSLFSYARISNILFKLLKQPG
jgi:hypothetical protein